MGDELARHQVQLVALSPDTVTEAGRMQRMNGFAMPLLADPDLKVIDLYGVRHQKGLGAPRKGSMSRPLAIPTTVLIDAEGIVRWIDQTDDYRVRSSFERVLAAVERYSAPPSVR